MLLAVVEQVDGDATQAVIFEGQEETAICLGDLLQTVLPRSSVSPRLTNSRWTQPRSAQNSTEQVDSGVVYAPARS
jgi:hypothetical protein